MVVVKAKIGKVMIKIDSIMKKNYVLIFAAGLVLLATACNKNEVDGQSATQEKEAVVTYIKATAKEDDTKASIDNSTGDFTWNTGDQIAVWADGYKISEGLADAYDGTNAATFSFKGLDESKRANFAIYPADFANSTYYTDTDLRVILPSSYTLAQVRDNVSPLPMIATNVEDGNLSFKQLCALLRVTVNNIPPSAKRLELNFHDNKVHGSFTVTLDEGIVKPAISTIATEGSSANDIITITKDGTDVTLNNNAWLDNLVLNIPIPVGTYTKVTVTAYDALTSGNAILTMTRPIKVSANWTATRANARKCTASLPAFSVSDSKRVHIAKSNLQLTRPSLEKSWEASWAAGDCEWSFLPESWSLQTGTIIDGKRYISYDHEFETQITLFAWGCSGYYDAEKTNTYFEPWRTVYKTDEIERAGKEFGTSTAINLTADSGYALGDWGVKACEGGALDDGYGEFTTWRVPTADEFMYLLGHTANDSSPSERNDDESNVKRYHKWGKGLINTGTESVGGFIIVPDYFVDPTGLFIEGYFSNFQGGKNTFTAVQWEMMVEAGAAFLPSTGELHNLHTHKDTKMIDISGQISYWSSTSYSANTHAKAFRIASIPETSTIEPASNLSRRNGSGIRLVRDLN